MQPLHPGIFDYFCEDGWCYWSDLLFRRNHWEWRGSPCRVIILRNNLREFQFSKSQRRCIRNNSDLVVLRRPLRITEAHEELFLRHAQRFSHNRPASMYGFFSSWSHLMPSVGGMLEVYKQDKLIAVSYFHVGLRSVAGNYCIFEPEEYKRSLGTFTMLLELKMAKHHPSWEYYYPGFVYDVPSEFDYKLNFNGLEYFDWWGNWYPIERMPVRDWRMDL